MNIDLQSIQPVLRDFQPVLVDGRGNLAPTIGQHALVKYLDARGVGHLFIEGVNRSRDKLVT